MAIILVMGAAAVFGRTPPLAFGSGLPDLVRFLVSLEFAFDRISNNHTAAYSRAVGCFIEPFELSNLESDGCGNFLEFGVAHEHSLHVRPPSGTNGVLIDSLYKIGKTSRWG